MKPVAEQLARLEGMLRDHWEELNNRGRFLVVCVRRALEKDLVR
jgi:hypothetical protein